MPSIPIKERFMSKVQKTDSCWIWMASAMPNGGYGHLHFKGKSKAQAHRVSYLLFKGDIPDGLLVCHKCNNKRCVNPDHLYLGTNRQNVLDAIRDGLYANRKYARGSKASHAKLTDDQVREIRDKYGDIVNLGKKIRSANGVTMQQLSKEYGISFAQINHLINRHTYIDVI